MAVAAGPRQAGGFAAMPDDESIGSRDAWWEVREVSAADRGLMIAATGEHTHCGVHQMWQAMHLSECARIRCGVHVCMCLRRGG